MKLNMLILLLLVAVVVLGNHDASGQFVWTKDSRNPILSGGGKGAWDNSVLVPWVIFNSDSARYEMWYTASPPGGNIGFAVSSDGITWKRDANPVLSTSPSKWDSYFVGAPSVIRENGQYKMWYTGAQGSSGGIEVAANRIGYATSPDGRTWTKYSGNPVLAAGASAWESGGVEYCSVIKSPGGYEMFYDGFTPTLTLIGRATSADGITWQRDTVHNPVLNKGGAGAWDGNVYLPRVVSFGGKHYMWYTAESVPGGGSSKIGVATSADSGKTWVKYAQNPILTLRSSGSWEESWIELGSALLVGNTFHLWYDGGLANVGKVGHATAPLVPQGVWQLQNSNFPADVGPGGFAAVSNRACWAPGVKLDGSSVYPGYIRTTDGGSTWVCDSIPGAENGLQFSMVAIDADTAYVAVCVHQNSSSKGVYKTTDGGATWTKQDAYSSALYGPGYIYFFDANNGVVIGDPNLETYTTSNGGRNWNSVSMPTALSNEYTWAGGPCISGYGNRVWFSTGDRVFRSTDKGYTWSASSPEVVYDMWHPFVAFQDSNTGIYALRKSKDTPHLYRKTTNGGVTWNTLSNPILDNLAPTCVLHVPGTKATYVVAGGRPEGMNGLACTYDGGNNWNLLDTTAVFDMGFVSDTVGWADDFTTNRVFKYVGPRLITSIEDGIVAPSSFILLQNYPNPFNPTTLITYQLQVASSAKLVVYDLLGREVAVLVNERKAPGSYQVKFDAAGRSSGVYFYRLTAGNFVQTRRMIVIK